MITPWTVADVRKCTIDSILGSVDSIQVVVRRWLTICVRNSMVRRRHYVVLHIVGNSFDQFPKWPICRAREVRSSPRPWYVLISPERCKRSPERWKSSHPTSNSFHKLWFARAENASIVIMLNDVQLRGFVFSLAPWAACKLNRIEFVREIWRTQLTGPRSIEWFIFIF